MFNIKDVGKIKGYNTISKNKEMFEGFLKFFINHGNGMEARETIKPISIKFIKDGSEKYLRFDYEIYGKKEWLHITGVDNWY